MNRNSERIPAEGPANKYGGRTCGGVSEQIKNRLYSLRSKIPRPLCGGELQLCNRKKPTTPVKIRRSGAGLRRGVRNLFKRGFRHCIVYHIARHLIFIRIDNHLQ